MTHPDLTFKMAQTRTDELRTLAERSRRIQEPRMPAADPIRVTIRFSHSGDTDGLRALAHLDCAKPLTLPALVAEVNGELRAALSLADTAIIADPFHPSIALVELLRTRAHQLTDTRPLGRLAALRYRRRIGAVQRNLA